jgi:phospholipid/cholesterol/gamma-HCH transport system ATP-binding protein
LNEFIFASEFLRDAKDMRMLEETGKIANDRNMEELTNKEAPTLVPPPDEETNQD